MDVTNSFRQPGDIGGPMNLPEEYRWNVPMLTYAFDQTFVDFFGSNGVAAIESAISLLNSLPPASQLNPGNYPPGADRRNYQAQSEGLSDLKSQALFLLVEHLGLAQPTRFMFSLHDFAFSHGQIVGTVIQRNFDPFSLAPSNSVNDTFYTYKLHYYKNGPRTYADAVEFEIDPSLPTFTAVADGAVGPGVYYTGLTRDDIGGLRYLLSSNRVNDEILLPDVHGAGTNAAAYVNRALRPGVEKIAFVRQIFDSRGQAVPITNQFIDTYITNQALVHQQLERDITQPDFLFCSADLSEGDSSEPSYARTATGNWWNSAVSGGTMLGPGVIRPPVKITFHKRGPLIQTADVLEGTATVDNRQWASFDSSPNPPVPYPDGTGTNQLTVHLWLSNTNTLLAGFTWKLPLAIGGAVLLQTSTNLADWVSLTTVTNNGTVIGWHHAYSRPQRFFRLVPQ